MIQCQTMAHESPIKEEHDVMNDVMNQENPFSFYPVFQLQQQQQHHQQQSNSSDSNCLSLELSPPSYGQGMPLGVVEQANLVGTVGAVRVSAGKCKVCEDEATGMYFGALVCVPCKTFFLRYAGDGFSFVCKGNKDCEISVSSRTQCKYCRYQKCLEAGMYRRVRPAQVQISDGQQLCVVCHDLANGIHFGAITCEGCKKFFRRGLTENKLYSCKSGQNCVINPRTRNSCRYCRYQTCLKMGMSREAIQMGRPSKMSSDSSSLHSTQQRAKSNFNMAPGVFDSSMNMTQFNFGSVTVRPAGKHPPSRTFQEELMNIQTDKNNPLLWQQDAFGNQGFSLGDAARQMMGFEMFEPAVKRLHSSEGYQSSPSLTGSFSPSGSVSTTERSGSTDSNRSLLSASSPEMVSALNRTWSTSDPISDGSVMQTGSYDGSGQRGSPFRVDKGKHLQTIQEQFSLPMHASQKHTEHLSHEFRHKKLNIPHTVTTSSSGGHVTTGLEGSSLHVDMASSEQLTPLQTKNLSELIEDMLHGSSMNRTSTLQRPMLSNDTTAQHFDFDTEFAALSTQHANPGNHNNFFKFSTSSIDDANLAAKLVFQSSTAVGAPHSNDNRFEQPNTSTHMQFNILENSGQVIHIKPFPLMSGSSGQFKMSFSPPASMSVSSSVVSSDAASSGRDHLLQLEGSSSLSSATTSRSTDEGMEYASNSPSCSSMSAENWLKMTTLPDHLHHQATFKSEPIFSSSSTAVHLSAEALTLDAEGMISSVDHRPDVYRMESSDLLSKSDSSESSSADNFIIDGIISLDEQIAESRHYWQNIKLPDENVVFAGKHWEVVNRVLPSYNRFVQLGTNVNRKLKQDFDKWVEQRSPEECCRQLSTWIQTEVVPIYTLTSITYLKSLPGFTSFQAEDQGILIRLGQSQSRILVAALHWYDSDERNFRNFLSWREIKFGSMDPYKQKLLDYAEKINQLELDSVESALLNVLVILSTDYPGLKRPDLIEESQKQILGTFRAYTTAKFGAPNTRLENLFRYMPDIRRLGLIHYKMTLTPTFGIAQEMQQKAETSDQFSN